MDTAQLPIISSRPGQRKAALLGLALVAAPAVFLFSMVMKHELGVNLSVFDLVGGFFGSLDHHPLTRLWFSPVVFGLLPLVAVVLNGCSILQLTYARERRLITLTLEIKLLNLLVLLFAGGVLGVVFVYQFVETFLGRG